jgi:hypothetical protein
MTVILDISVIALFFGITVEVIQPPRDARRHSRQFSVPCFLMMCR